MHFVVGEGWRETPLTKSSEGPKVNPQVDQKGPPVGVNNSKTRVGISTEIAAVLKTAFEAIWAAPGKLLAFILDQNGVDFGPPGAGKQDPANQKQRARF